MHQRFANETNQPSSGSGIEVLKQTSEQTGRPRDIARDGRFGSSLGYVAEADAEASWCTAGDERDRRRPGRPCADADK